MTIQFPINHLAIKFDYDKRSVLIMTDVSYFYNPTMVLEAIKMYFIKWLLNNEMINLNIEDLFFSYSHGAIMMYMGNNNKSLIFKEELLKFRLFWGDETNIEIEGYFY